MKKIIAVCTTALIAVGLAVTGASAASAESGGPGKVFVCKYVGTPGVDERLQTGQNPISVSVNSIKGEVFVGAEFADGQGKSIVIAFDDENGGGQYGEPTIEDCPAPVGPPVDEPETTTPLPPLFEDVCGTANDVTRIPDDTDEYTYVGDVTEAGLSTVTATAAKGFVFDSGYDTLTWTFEFTNEACPVVVPPVVYPPTEQPPVAVPPVVQPPVLPDCDDLSYESAQELLASDSTKYGYLDNNKDGIACDALAATPVAETLPETGTDTSGTLLAGGAAFLLLMAGAAALLFKRREATE